MAFTHAHAVHSSYGRGTLQIIIERDGTGRRQVQRALLPRHRNADAHLRVRRQKLLRNTGTFLSEHQKISLPVSDITDRLMRLRRKKPDPAPRMDKAEFLKELGMKESGLDSVVRKGYEILGLRTFFTAGEKECRAWTFHAGYKAPQCAGVIHTAFERGFIRAETLSYEDFLKHGSWNAAKEAGLVRTEGKDYVVQDGDIMYFLFNV